MEFINYGTSDLFTHEQLEAGASLGKIRLVNDKHTYQALKDVLTTSCFTGVKYGNEDDEDDEVDEEIAEFISKTLEKYINPAFWHILRYSTNEKIVNNLFVELIRDVVLLADNNPECTILINLLNRIPYLLIKRPELIKCYTNVIFSENIDDETAIPLMNVFIVANINIYANDILDDIIKLYSPSLVSDMKMYGHTNTQSLKTGYRHLLTYHACNHDCVSYINLKPNEITTIDIPDPNAIKYADLSVDQHDLVRRQLYSALLALTARDRILLNITV